ncbi:MAG: CvpA family protein [Bacillota bacterium]|nr:CvpA family protein [Bacillota bacterium]
MTFDSITVSDLILLGFLLLGAFYGWRLGTINVIAKIGAYVLGYQAARYASPFVASYIAELFPGIKETIDKPALDAFFSLFFNSDSGSIATRLLEVVSFVVVFTVVCWLVRRLAYAMTGAFGRGLLGSLNRALGAVASALICVVLIVVLTDVVLPALVGMGMGKAPLEFFEKSQIVVPALRNLQDLILI